MKNSKYRRNVQLNIIVAGLFLAAALMGANATAMQLEWQVELMDSLRIYPEAIRIVDPDNYLIACRSNLGMNGRDPVALDLYRIDGDGNVIWQTRYSHNDNVFGLSYEGVLFDEDGNTYVFMQDENWQSWIAKFDFEGEREWEFEVGTVVQASHYSHNLQFDVNGNIVALVEEALRGGAISHLVTVSREGELVRHITANRAPNFRPMETAIGEELLFIGGYRPSNDIRRDSTDVILTIHDLDGNYLTSMIIGTVPTQYGGFGDLQVGSDGSVYVLYNQWNNGSVILWVTAIDPINRAVIWTSANEEIAYPDRGGVTSRLVITQDNGVLHGGGIDGTGEMGGPLLFKFSDQEGQIEWAFSEDWAGDDDHFEGALTQYQVLDDESTLAIGFGLTGGEDTLGGGYLQARDLAVFHLDERGNEFERMTAQTINWGIVIPEVMDVSPEGFAVIAARKYQLRPPQGGEEFYLPSGLQLFKVGFDEFLPPDIGIPLEHIDYGEVEPEEIALSAIPVNNNGEGVARITGVVFEGEIALQLTLASAMPLLIQPGGSDTIRVLWTPQGRNYTQGSIKVYHNDPDLESPFVITCSGNLPNSVDGGVESPTSFSLADPFPNPFNASSTIRFSLANSGQTKMSVIDITGKEVVTLLNSSLEAGRHSLTWNAEGCAPGVYLIRLESAGQAAIVKSLLIK